jgi:lipase chaperone LimK
VFQNTSLGAAEREQRLRELELALPPGIREEYERAEAPQRALREVEALRAGGGSAQEIFALRERAFGRKSAEQLAALDAERAAWNQRWSAYRAERDALIAGGARLAPGDLAAQLEQLQRGHFKTEELPRVQAMDSTQALARALEAGSQGGQQP